MEGRQDIFLSVYGRHMQSTFSAFELMNSSVFKYIMTFYCLTVPLTQKAIIILCRLAASYEQVLSLPGHQKYSTSVYHSQYIWKATAYFYSILSYEQDVWHGGMGKYLHYVEILPLNLASKNLQIDAIRLVCVLVPEFFKVH
jgi:hypothetical protein